MRRSFVIRLRPFRYGWMFGLISAIACYAMGWGLLYATVALIAPRVWLHHVCENERLFELAHTVSSFTFFAFVLASEHSEWDNRARAGAVLVCIWASVFLAVRRDP